jgi:hypothetical protein
MVDLLLQVLQLFGTMLPIRLTAVISGLLAIGCGMLIFAVHPRGPFILIAILLVAGGVALIVMGITLRVPGPAASELGTPPADDWTSPNGEEIRKIVKARCRFVKSSD